MLTSTARIRHFPIPCRRWPGRTAGGRDGSAPGRLVDRSRSFAAVAFPFPQIPFPMIECVGPRYMSGALEAGAAMWGGKHQTASVDRPTVSQTRAMSSSYRRGRGIDMSSFGSLGEMISVVHNKLGSLSNRDISAFWTQTLKYLQGRVDGSLGCNPDTAELDGILCHTLEGIMTNTESFSPRDLSQTAISLAKIMKTIEDRRGRVQKGSPHQILRNVLIGHNSQNKQFILRELTVAAMPMREEFDPRSLSNLVYAIGVAKYALKFDDGRTSFDVLADVGISKLKNFNGQDISNMLWAYGNVKVSNSRLFKKTADHIISLRSLGSFKPQELSNIVWAYATLDESHPTLFTKVVDHIVALDSLHPFKPQELSNIVWAFATAKEAHPALFRKVADHIVALDSLQPFKPQELSNIVWAYAAIKEAHPALFRKVADHIMSLDSLDAFKPQELANIAWAYSTAGELHPKLYKKLGDHIASLKSLDAFATQALSNIAWAYASAKEPHPKLFKKLGDHVVALDGLNAFKPQELSNTLWAYATTKEAHPALFRKVADDAIKRRPEFIPQDIANLLWAYATNGQIDQRLFKAFAPMAADLLGKYNEQNLANLAWAYAVADVPALSLFNEDLIKVCQEKEDTLTVEELSQLHQWTLWQEELKSSVRLPPSLQQKCHDAFVSSSVSPSGLQNEVISVLSSIGLHPQEEVLTEKGYRLDALVEVNGIKTSVEVDGPTHFLGRKPTGSTILKRRQVAALEGIPLGSVPYWEWNKLGKPGKNREKKEQYLRALLGMS